MERKDQEDTVGRRYCVSRDPERELVWCVDELRDIYCYQTGTHNNWALANIYVLFLLRTSQVLTSKVQIESCALHSSALELAKQLVTLARRPWRCSRIVPICCFPDTTADREQPFCVSHHCGLRLRTYDTFSHRTRGRCTVLGETVLDCELGDARLQLLTLF